MMDDKMPNDHPWAEEPWTVEEYEYDWYHIKDKNEQVIDESPGNDWEITKAFSKEERARIIACVNACAGVLTEDLLAIANGHMIACKHCGHNYRVPFQGKESVFDGVLLKCPSCKKESEWPKEEWPTVKEPPDAAD